MIIGSCIDGRYVVQKYIDEQYYRSKNRHDSTSLHVPNRNSGFSTHSSLFSG